MNDSQNSADLLIRYMDGELTGEELITFEAALQQDAALQAELDDLNLAKKVVEHYGLQQQVKAVHRQMITERVKRPVVSLKYVLRIAAIFLFCILSFGTYQYINLSPSAIFPADEPAFALNTERGTTTSSAIEKAYRQQDYSSVISKFESETHPGATEQFLAAQSYRALHRPGKAISIFKSMNNQIAASTYQDDIDYYLGLSYLENNEPSAANVLLEKIYTDKDHLYHDRVDKFTLLKLKLYIFKSGK